MKIYTKSGDKGKTSLYDGTRVEKSSPIIQILGEIDELNSFLGLAKCKVENKDFAQYIEDIQHQLYRISAQVSTPNTIQETFPTDDLENKIDQITETLPAISCFTTPGSNEVNALFHICRTVCRRAERSMQPLQNSHQNAIIYINRLSDLLYSIARATAK